VSTSFSRASLRVVVEGGAGAGRAQAALAADLLLGGQEPVVVELHGLIVAFPGHLEKDRGQAHGEGVEGQRAAGGEPEGLLVDPGPGNDDHELDHAGRIEVRAALALTQQRPARGAAFDEQGVEPAVQLRAFGGIELAEDRVQ